MADSASELVEASDKAPRNGDFSVCINCGAILIFTEAAKNRLKPAAQEDIGLLELGAPEVAAYLFFAQRYLRGLGPIAKRKR
jgi:hypothetical protein